MQTLLGIYKKIIEEFFRSLLNSEEIKVELGDDSDESGVLSAKIIGIDRLVIPHLIRKRAAILQCLMIYAQSRDVNLGRIYLIFD